MLYRITYTLLTCVLLYGVSQAYALAVRPMLAQQGDAPDLASHVAMTRNLNVAPKDHIETAQKYLPDQKWALDAKIRVHRDNMYIFCGNWERTDEERSIRFEPFAIVFHPKPKEGEPIDETKEKSTVTVVAESAIIEFKKSVKLNEIDPELIERGILVGKVHVTGTDNVKLDGRNFIFDRTANHIRSDHQVSFSWQGHSGFAQSFEMELLEDEEKGFEELAYSGLKSVILRRNIQLLMKPEKEPFPVLVRAAGSLHYQFESMLATIQDHVLIERQTSVDEKDTLICQQLNMAFKEKKTEKTKTSDKKSEPETKVELVLSRSIGTAGYFEFAGKPDDRQP